MKRWIGSISVVVILAGAAWAFLFLKAWHPLGSMGVRLDYGRGVDFSLRFKGAELVGRQDGRKAWTMNAAEITMSRDRRLVVFQGSARGTLMKDGKTAATLAAEKIVYNTLTGNVLVPDAADFKVTNGPSFKVKNVLWDGRKSVLYCKGGAEGSVAGGPFRADRITADLAQKAVTTEKVSGTINLPEPLYGMED